MSALVTWCLFDGKPGHENQVMGLVNALGELVSLDPCFFSVNTSLINWGLGRFPAGKPLRSPDLLIGAGHGTHIPLLTARHARGGRVILLMNPSLPTALFDLCIIPVHDRPRLADNILLSRGSLSRIRPSTCHNKEQGLILIGGPSRNYTWSDDAVIQQVRAIVSRSPDWNWVITTSRRTPETFVHQLHACRELTVNKEGNEASSREIVRWPETGSEWIFEQLGRAQRVWVTEDSVSMVYDALTTGAEVCLINLPKRRSGRVAWGVQRLVEDELVLSFDAWQQGREPSIRNTPFNESARCAAWIKDHWLSVH